MKQVKINVTRWLFVCFIFLLGLSTSCNKEENEPETTTNTLYEIRGTLYFTDGYSGSSTTRVLPNQVVYIRVDTSTFADTNSFFYATNTDKNGLYNFYIEDRSLPYKVFTSFHYKNSKSFDALYYGAAHISAFESNLVLQDITAKIDTNYQNGIILTTIDSFGHKVSDAQVFLYTSRLIAVSDSSSFSGKASLKSINTDSLGKAFIANLPSDSLYINARLALSTNTFKTVAFPIYVGEAQIISSTIILK